jgi:hypothetical protein
MDGIRFETVRTDTSARASVETVSVFVNGRDLVHLAKEAELPFAVRGGNPRLAGQYIGLPAEAVFSPSRRLLGEPDERYDDWDGRISVLGCGCGVVGCWPLQVKIKVKKGLVVWEDFRRPHRPRWSYDALGPLVFDREEYETILRESSGV